MTHSTGELALSAIIQELRNWHRSLVGCLPENQPDATERIASFVNEQFGMDEHGFVDFIVDRRNMKNKLTKLLEMLQQ